MIELREWMASAGFADRPWLLVGKGPTFARRDEIDLGAYNVASLNHVVNEIDVDVAHIADIDVVADCADRLLNGCRWLLMPRYPHVELAAQRRLEDWFDEHPVLRRLDEAGRLVWYNLHTGEPVGDSPVIQCRHFGSEVVLDVLGRLGARTVRTLGVDGGTAYATDFSAQEARRLNTGAPSFDVQFFELDRIAAGHDIDLAPALGPIRIFIGADDTQQVAFRVMEHSIRSHTAQPVEVVNLRDHPTRQPAGEANQGHTGFSLSRFAIPELCGYEGRAIYFDADMLVFDDVLRLWQIRPDGPPVRCTTQLEPPPQWVDHPDFHRGKQLSVMVLDCSRLDWKVDEIVDALDRGQFTYGELMYGLCILPPDHVSGDLPPEWNHLERHVPGETKNLHFTVVNEQPWKNDLNPLREIWERAYREAVAAGAVPPEEVAEGIRARFLKGSLADALADAPSTAVGGPDGQAARHHIDALNAEIERLTTRLTRLEGRLESMRRSPTWRAGRAIIGPLDAVRNRLRRRRS